MRRRGELLVLTLALALAAPASRAALFRSKPAPPPAREPGPFDPLSPSEIETAVSTLRASGLFSADALFPSVDVQEPAKDELSASTRTRAAQVVILDRNRAETSEAVVDLKARKLLSWRLIPDAQPRLTEPERRSVEKTLADDPRWRAALARRSLKPPDVFVELWPADLGRPGRLAAAGAFAKGRGSRYARPVAGLTAVVDLTQGKVVDLLDTEPFTVPPDEPAPAQAQEPPPKPARARKRAKAPLAQAAPPFSLEAGQVRWRGWSFHAAVRPREGLVLHSVAFSDSGKPRSVLYRASLSEVLSVSGDPDRAQALRDGLVVGELGLGRFTRPLVPGLDAPASAAYIDASFSDDEGRPYLVKRAAAVYERPAAAGGPELVVVSRAVVGPSSYGLRWQFRPDGELLARAEVGGTPLARGVDASTAARRSEGYVLDVSSGVAAPVTQSFLCFRLDFDVDGTSNSLVELDAAPAPARGGLAAGIGVERLPLRTEHAARRDALPQTARRWLVENRAAGTAYALAPEDNDEPAALLPAAVRRKAPFMTHQLWATPYRPDELYAAGDYPGRADGLERWTSRDESIEDDDLVLWYTLGVTVVPRPEDWPDARPVVSGFRLLPWGFLKP